jgi:hypothetical protein
MPQCLLYQSLSKYDPGPGANDSPIPIEECGNMQIKALTYARALDSKAAAECIDYDGVRTVQAPEAMVNLPRWLFLGPRAPDKQPSAADFIGRLENQTK